MPSLHSMNGQPRIREIARDKKVTRGRVSDTKEAPPIALVPGARYACFRPETPCPELPLQSPNVLAGGGRFLTTTPPHDTRRGACASTRRGARSCARCGRRGPAGRFVIWRVGPRCRLSPNPLSRSPEFKISAAFATSSRRSLFATTSRPPAWRATHSPALGRRSPPPLRCGARMKTGR